MCTVTYIPVKEKIFFTSNRDEKNWRTPAVPPAVHPFNSGRIMFPKDPQAGGTWIAGHENGNVVVFLNGGFIAHVPNPPYRKSRGLVLLDLIDHPTPFNSFLAINLNNIEPFTAVIFDNARLFECRWDGSRKHTFELDVAVPAIWSSATLYSEEVSKKRNRWFDEFISGDTIPTGEKILHFHQFTGDGDSTNDLLMDREGKIGTVSITCLELSPAAMKMHYLDVKNNKLYPEQLLLDASIAGRS